MELILAWQNPKTRRWYPVARVDRDGDEYRLRYVNGLSDPGVLADAIIPGLEDPSVEYRSRSLFPFLKNRIYNRKRADFGRYREWLGLNDGEIADPLKELAVSGGVRATDSYQLFPVPAQSDGRYVTTFFIHGSRYVADAISAVTAIHSQDRLLLQLDIQNAADPAAISLRTDRNSDKAIVGYIPRLMQFDVHALIEKNGPESVTVRVDGVYTDAPLSLRHRCILSAPWPSGFQAYAPRQFQPVSTDQRMAVVA
jgi:hypothetical protein